MQPSKQDIDNFLAFAPVADEQRASLFLKVYHLMPLRILIILN